MAIAEKDVFDIQTNPYFLSLDAIDELTMEIEELKVFSVEVRRVLREEGQTASHSPNRYEQIPERGRVQGRRAERERSSSSPRWREENGDV